MKIDAHQHFWVYDSKKHDWIDDRMKVIQKDFLPGDLAPILQSNAIDGCVAVQADQTEAETNFLLNLAEKNEFVKGVVGWVDLQSKEVASRLEHYAQNPFIKGFRHVIQGEPDPNFILRPQFVRGVRLLQTFGFTYDILVFPFQLGAVLEFIRKNPELPLVIDHLAKPYIKDGYYDGWATLMREIAQYDNVVVKVSGLVTEADWTHWKPSDYSRYLDLIFEAFGTKRILFGSDWPVCLLAAQYDEMKALVDHYMTGFSDSEQNDVMGLNAMRFYKL